MLLAANLPFPGRITMANGNDFTLLSSALCSNNTDTINHFFDLLSRKIDSVKLADKGLVVERLKRKDLSLDYAASVNIPEVARNNHGPLVALR